jgi:hypothetical protein
MGLDRDVVAPFAKDYFSTLHADHVRGQATGRSNDWGLTTGDEAGLYAGTSSAPTAVLRRPVLTRGGPYTLPSCGRLASISLSPNS